MNRTALRALAALATTAAVALSPVVSTPAQADTRAGASVPSVAGADTSDAAFATALREARDDYRAAVTAVRTNLRTTMDGIRAQVLAETTGSRLSLADARARHQGEVDMALASAKSSLQTARTLYINAFAAAYARYAPGQPVPRIVTDPTWSPGPADRPWPVVERVATR